ncbi:MAG: LamB/YcsF family protein [Actinomycetota bacterium]|nr:LamB/YcsF family protein [Actinomycetota bacterium]
MGVRSIDLNADLAEECGDDEAMYRYISSASICCGRHAGSPNAMKKAVAAAVRHNVVIGAHVGYEDRANFGRSDVKMEYNELRKLTFNQIHDLLDVVNKANTRVQYVKPHGALYHRIGSDSEQAKAVVDAIAEIDSTLHILVPETGIIKSAAAGVGLTVAHEFFADRVYLPVGTLVPRTVVNSVLNDSEKISERVLHWLATGEIAANDGTQISVNAQSICLHGDTPDAVASAASIYQKCKSAGYGIKSWLSS